jgi:hypothetical protein
VSESFDFSSLSPVEIPVVGPDGKQYVLKEANGTAAKRYNDARTGGILFEGGQLKKIEGAGSLEPLLVSLCLFAVEGEGEKKVLRPMANHQPYIEREFPARVIKQLYNKAREISNLEEGNPVGDAMKKALSHPNAPVSYESFKEFVEGLQGDKEIRPLALVFRET